MQTEIRLIPSFFTGEFDSDIETDITYVPLTLMGRSKRFEFRATVPFLSITTEEPVTFVGGDVIPREGRGKTTESGLGDVVLQGDYFVKEGDARRPWIHLSMRVKLPTADKNRGLGSGETDVGPGVGMIQPVGSRWYLIGEARYVIRGDSPEVDYRNTLWISAGAQARVSESSWINFFYDQRDSVLGDRPTIRDVIVGYDRRISRVVKLQSNVFYGLSDTAEDYGLSLGLSFRKPPPK